jgi:ankyrin repeat protein
MKTTAVEAVEKRGSRLLRFAEKVPRFKHSRQAKALMDAIRYDDSELAVWLLKRGVDPESRDNKGRTALWWAAARCLPEVIRELVKRGAVLTEDVLMGPVTGLAPKTVRFLIQRGANVNCVASEYRGLGHLHIKEVLLTAALRTAAVHPQVESIPIMLIRAGAKVNRVILQARYFGAEGRSMLGLAAYHGLLKTVEAMIAAGADVNLRDNHGRTPLFDALEQGHLRVTKVLLRAGARTDIKDSAGVTPRQALEKQEQSPEMLLSQFMIAHGSKVNRPEIEAQALAWRRRRTRMLSLLERHGRGVKSP